MSRDGHLDWSRKTWQPSLLYRVARLGIMKSLTSHQQTFRLRWYDLAAALGWKGLSFSFVFLPDILFFPFLCKGMTIFYREERKKKGGNISIWKHQRETSHFQKDVTTYRRRNLRRRTDLWNFFPSRHFAALLFSLQNQKTTIFLFPLLEKKMSLDDTALHGCSIYRKGEVRPAINYTLPVVVLKPVVLFKQQQQHRNRLIYFLVFYDASPLLKWLTNLLLCLFFSI